LAKKRQGRTIQSSVWTTYALVAARGGSFGLQILLLVFAFSIGIYKLWRRNNKR